MSFLHGTGKFGTAASTGVVMPPKPQMIAKQDWRYVSGGGRVMRNAHEPSTEITGLAFASNGHSIVTRGADETLKVPCCPWLCPAFHRVTLLPLTGSQFFAVHRITLLPFTGSHSCLSQDHISAFHRITLLPFNGSLSSLSRLGSNSLLK